MSTAILHAGSFIHDFNDIVIKVCISWSSSVVLCEFIANFISQKMALCWKAHVLFP